MLLRTAGGEGREETRGRRRERDEPRRRRIELAGLQFIESERGCGLLEEMIKEQGKRWN